MWWGELSEKFEMESKVPLLVTNLLSYSPSHVSWQNGSGFVENGEAANLKICSLRYYMGAVYICRKWSPLSLKSFNFSSIYIWGQQLHCRTHYSRTADKRVVLVRRTAVEEESSLENDGRHWCTFPKTNTDTSNIGDYSNYHYLLLFYIHTL